MVQTATFLFEVFAGVARFYGWIISLLIKRTGSVASLQCPVPTFFEEDTCNIDVTTNKGEEK